MTKTERTVELHEPDERVSSAEVLFAMNNPKTLGAVALEAIAALEIATHLERISYNILMEMSAPGKHVHDRGFASMELMKLGLIKHETVSELQRFRSIRNIIAHDQDKEAAVAHVEEGSRQVKVQTAANNLAPSTLSYTKRYLSKITRFTKLNSH
jgi:hypothetical protein